MEADEYFQAYEALKEDDSHGRLTLKVGDPCGITKIVWSSFDFMTGPELRFVWEVVPSNLSLTPVNLSGEEGSVIDNSESLDSSVSATSAQFEDIDDPLKGVLLTAAPECEVLIDTAFDDLDYSSSPLLSFNLNAREGGGQYLDDYMTDSRSTVTTGTFTNSVNDSRMQESFNSSFHLEDSGTSTDLESLVEAGKKVAQNSAHDPMSGTPVESINMSRLLTNYDEDELTPVNEDESKQNTVSTRTSTNSTTSTVTVLTNDSSFGNIDQLNDLDRTPIARDIEEDTVDEYSSERTESEGVYELMTSFVDSGIVGTVSTHSELSALCNSSVGQRRSAILDRSTMDSSIFRSPRPDSTDPDDDMVLDVDVPLDPPDEQPSDELFVAKYVLAEQICSTQLPSNPLLHKMTFVPARSLLAASFLFSHKDEKDKNARSMHAISLIMGHKRLEWYMQRERVIESIIGDIVPRIKASVITEEWEDTVVRLTSELTRFLELLGSLERFPLVPGVVPLRIRQTLLGGKTVGDDKLLAKAISGVLQCQGYCVVIGNDHAFISKLLLTLLLFVPSELRWCCLRAYRHKYDPYLRLQAVRRSELPHVILQGVRCDWPICIVDVDRSTVCVSAPYHKHKILRSKVETHVVNAILQQHILKERSNMKLELSSVKILEMVRSFLSHMDLLPLEESSRMGFVEQFRLQIYNYARAFIGYVKDSSEPLSKECGVRSSKFSLSECRKALDLQQDGLFNAVLAHAELIHPQIADFVYLE